MKKCDEASPSIILAGQVLLMKMLITLEPDGLFGSNSVYIYIYVFKHCPATGMKKDEEASPCIFFAGQALLVKIFITLGPHSIILFKFCILI